MKLQGILIAATTPFDFDGRIYKAKVQHNIEKWNRTAVGGYVFATITGEGPLLREMEKIALWEMAAQHRAPGKLLIADVSAEGVEEAATLAVRAGEIGFNAVISGVPQLYKTMMYGPETQMLYFRCLADRSPIPVLIENAPAYTGVDLLPETAVALSAHPNLIGIVETGTPPVRIERIRNEAEAGFQVLAGSSAQLWESFEKGATGALLPIASAVPYACITVWEAFRMREREAGLDWQERLTQPALLTTDLYGVPGLKYAMELNGYYSGPPRLPFSPPNAGARQAIEEAFRDLRG